MWMWIIIIIGIVICGIWAGIKDSNDKKAKEEKRQQEIRLQPSYYIQPSHKETNRQQDVHIQPTNKNMFNYSSTKKPRRPKLNNVEAFPQFRALCEISIDGFSADDFEVLKRLQGRSAHEQPGGIINAYCQDINVLIQSFLKAEYISISSYAEQHEYLTVVQLKEILKANGSKVSGRKAKLLERVKNEVSCDFIKSRFPEHAKERYLYTEKGKEALNNYFSERDSILFEVEKNVFPLVCKRELDDAFRIAYYYLKTSPTYISKHPNFDESSTLYKGLSATCSLTLKNFLKAESMAEKFEKSAIVTAILLNESSYNLPALCNRLSLSHILENAEKPISLDLMKEAMESLRNALKEGSLYSDSYNHNITELTNYEKEDIQQYRFLATLDNRTCEVCGKLDGKIFNVSEAQIGVNCPPMHKGCRCTTVAHFDSESFDGLQRRARNPETGKNELIPTDITWEQWKNQYK